MRVYTIGHGSRKLEEFLSLLKMNKITLLVDVRRFPTSKKEQFKRENLERTLGSNGIKYLWVGKSLGGFRKGGYEKYMEEEEFKTGISELLENIRGEIPCLMCLEITPKGCHRRFVSRYLTNLGIDVFHIISSARVEKHNE